MNKRKKKRIHRVEKPNNSSTMYKKVQPIVAAKKQLSDTLPRRKAEQLKYCYGLDQVELGHTKPDPCHALASKLWESTLRHTWRKFHPPHHDYGFVPSSLSDYTIRVIRKHGVAGIHYAEGWEGLYNMYTMCGGNLTTYEPEPTKEMLERRSAKPAKKIMIKQEEDVSESPLTSAAKNSKDSKQSDPLMFLSSVAEKTGSGWGENTARKSQDGKKYPIEVDLDVAAPPLPGGCEKTTTEHTNNEGDYDDETLVTESAASRQSSPHQSKRSDPSSSPLLLQMKKRRVSRPPERFASLRQVSLIDVQSFPDADDNEEESECPPPPPLFFEQSTSTQNDSNINDDNDTTSSKRESDDDSSSDSETSSEATKEETNLLEERLAKMERRITHLEREIQRRDDLLASQTLTQSASRQKKTLSERIDDLEMLYGPKKKSRRAKEGNTGTERVTRLEMILFDCVQPGGLLSRVERLEDM